MYLYKQYDSRWGKKYYRATKAGTSTMASSGCGPSSCANVEQFFDSKVTPWTAAQWMMANGYATNGNGTLHSGIKNYFLALGQSCTWLTERAGNQYGKEAEEYAQPFREALKTGNYGVILVGKSDWTNGGHYLAAVDSRVRNGVEEFYIIDSGIKQRNGWWPWSAFKGVVKHLYSIKNPDAGKKSYDGTYPDKFPLRGYYKLGDGYKTNVYAKYIEQIKRIQEYLNWANTPVTPLVIDGQYGPRTRDEVKVLQMHLHLVEDGEYGKKTLAASKLYKK